MSTLYAWANPLSPESIIGFLDHTWVTDYPFKNNQYPTINDIPKAAKYWYCWGEYHKAGNGGIHKNPNGAIGNQDGNLKIASKLVTPNVPHPPFPGTDPDSQGGSIFYYAVDGVCHMVANQALFATGTKSKEPLRVLEANGYNISSFFYSDYGLNNKVWNASKVKYAPMTIQPNEYFPQHLENMNFMFEQEAAIKLTRGMTHQAFRELHTKVPNMKSYEVKAAIGVIVSAAFYAIKKAVGVSGFLKLFPSFKQFPSTKEQAIYWIDQEQLEHSMNYIHKTHQAQE